MHNSLLATLPLLIMASVCLMLPGCKKSLYNPKALSNITLGNTSTNIHDNIIIHCKLLSKQETHMLFDGRGSRLLRKRNPFNTLYLCIENNSQKSYILDPHNIAIPLINPESAAQRLYAHTSRRIALPLITGTLMTAASFLGAAYITMFGIVCSVPAAVKAGYATLALSGTCALATPAICYYQANHCLSLNALIHEDVLSKSLHQPMLIEAGSTLQTLLFVGKKHYHNGFSVRLIESTSRTAIPYDIAVEEGDRPCKK